MHVLTMADAVAVILSHSLYTGSRTKAVPELNAVGVDLRQRRAGYLETIAARNERADDLDEAAAQLDHVKDALYDTLKTLGLNAVAHFKSKTAPGYLRLFPEAPSDLHRTPQASWKTTYVQFLERAAQAETPSVLAPHVKELQKAWAVFIKGEGAVVTAAAAHQRAVADEETAKAAVVTCFTAAYGRIVTFHAAEPEKVERYFKKVKSGSRKKPGTTTETGGANPPA